ncbi:MAG: putative aminohydrolase SsnA [Anaerolineae bacterium]
MLILNGTLITFVPARPVIPRGGLRLVGDRIADVGPTSELAARYAGDEVLDATGHLVMPGLICSHTHFYGAFARGMALPGSPPRDFPQILERLWWRLDKALTLADVEASAEICLVDAIRHGVTTLFDHHASPRALEGSLETIAGVVRRAGVRACLCYEVSDRDGPEVARNGLTENGKFVRSAQREGNPLLAGLVGLHASMTLSDGTLERAVELAEDLGVGCHIHVAEDGADQQDALKRTGLRVVERLQRLGVLGPMGVAAHCVHVDGYERDLLRETGVHVAHNPRSNMNNAVGTAPVPAMLRLGVEVGLGNDGFSNNLFVEMHAAYLVHKLANKDPQAMPADEVLRLVYGGNVRLAERYFPSPLGRLEAGAMADVITVQYRPPTPLHDGNYPWHILFGVDGTGVRTTIVGGRVLMREGQVLTLDEERITARSRELAKEMWRRIEEAAGE